MTNQHSHRTPSVQLPWVLLVIFLLPAALSAHPNIQHIDTLSASLDESPFDDFEPLEGFEESPSGVAAADPAEWVDDEDAPEPPDAAVALRFDFDQTKTYKIRNGLRIDYDHRPDFAPVYQSGLFVEYYPIDDKSREEMAYWPVSFDADEGADDGTLVRITAGGAVGAFDEPDAFSDSTSVHPLLREATLTFRITDRGAISDVRVHPPTNPLLRSSVEELIRLLAASHPPLPDDDVSPGDQWSSSVEWFVGDASLEHSAQLTYTFERWAPCDQSHCAVIDIEQEVDATGRYLSGTLQTDGSSTATGLGRILFDFEGGRVVDAQWNLNARGAVVTTRTEDPDSDPINDFGFGMEVDTAVTLY